MADSDRRIYPRLKVPMLWRSPGMVARLRMVDVSLGGARVYSDDRLKLGTRVDLELLASPGSTVQVLARVVWIDELGPSGPARYDVGLEFLEVPEEMRSRLASILRKDEEWLANAAPRHPVLDDEPSNELPEPPGDEKKQ